MKRLSQNELLKLLDKCWSLYKTSTDEWKLAQQAYKQIEELIREHDEMKKGIHEIYQIVGILKKG